MQHRALATILVLLNSISTATLAVPALTDPLIKRAMPLEGQQGQQVLIEGVNFGTAPEVRFNGVLAAIDAYRADMGRIVVTVPGGAASGPIIVTNTDTTTDSTPAEFEIVPGTFTAACTIGGDVTNHLGAPLPDSLVVVLNALTGEFAGFDVTAAVSGSYSVDLGATGDHMLLFFPPQGAMYIQGAYITACAGIQNHQFATGLELSGHVESDTAAPIRNAWIGASSSGGSGNDVLTDASGDFALYLPPDTYEVQLVGPVGGRHIGGIIDSLPLSADTDLGNITLPTGVIVSGELHYQDDGDSGALGDGWVVDFDTDGEIAGLTKSIANGEFHLASTTGAQVLFSIFPDQSQHEPLAVCCVDIAADMELDFPFTVYTAQAQLPQVGTITGTGSMTVQEGQRLQFEAAGLRGGTVEFLFSDGASGTVAGLNTFAERDRGGLVTTVPTGAATGEAVVRIDGAAGPGYPLEVVPGVYDPGPYTTTGTITDGGSPVESVFVGIFELGCENEFLVDYDMTGVSGTYSVRHGAGDYFLFVMPPISTGLARSLVPMFGTTGGGVQNLALAAGNVVTGHCVDSGTGPVGSTDSIADCEVGGEGVDIDHDDWMLSDAFGDMVLNLPTGSYDMVLRPPYQSRYLYGGVSTFVITEDVDLGDAPMDSGYLVEGRIVNPSGDGLAGVEVSMWDVYEGEDAAETTTSGSDGRFRLAVPAGSYHLFTSVHPDHEYWVEPEFDIDVSSDLLLYPARQAEIAGHLRGTVLDWSMTPLEELPVQAFHDTYGFVRMADTCYDGSYDLKVPSGDYSIQAMPSWEELCLADEFYDGHYTGCGSDLVTLTAPATLTGLDFVLEPAGGISGTVSDDTGPVAGATVCTTNGSSNPSCYNGCTFTDGGGAFTLANVPVAADYQVDVVGPGYPWECWDDHLGCSDYDPVPVAECVDTALIDYHLSNFPGAVPLGDHVAGTPMTVRRGGSPGDVIIDWQPTCNASDHAIYFGTLGNFTSYVQAECNAGTAGSWPVTPPGGDIFWVVVGVNGANEGSYGEYGGGGERPSDGGAQCGYWQDLSGTCLPDANAPGAVPDGDHVAGAQMTVRPGLSPGEVIVDWQPTCDANDHAIYFGSLGSFASYTDAVCDAGMSGSWSLTPPGGNLFWVVVGVSGLREGSYGVDSGVVERPDDGGAHCGYVQDLGATCLP
jgi:hypothetical protein